MQHPVIASERSLQLLSLIWMSTKQTLEIIGDLRCDDDADEDDDNGDGDDADCELERVQSRCERCEVVVTDHADQDV